MEPLYYCEKCGKPVYERIGKYDTGRFCSRSCANSRIRTDEIKKKISDSVKSNFEYEKYNGKIYTKQKIEQLKKIKENPETLKLENPLIRYEYDVYDKKIYTIGDARKLKRQDEYKNDKVNGKYRKKGIDLFLEIDAENSPYKDFDSVYSVNFKRKNYKEREQTYLFYKHDSDNQIVEMKKIPYFRYVMEYKLGRKLYENEVVHHIDGNHNNNDLENLVVLSKREHSKIHSPDKFKYKDTEIYPLFSPLLDLEFELTDPLE